MKIHRFDRESFHSPCRYWHDHVIVGSNVNTTSVNRKNCHSRMHPSREQDLPLCHLVESFQNGLCIVYNLQLSSSHNSDHGECFLHLAPLSHSQNGFQRRRILSEYDLPRQRARQASDETMNFRQGVSRSILNTLLLQGHQEAQPKADDT